MNSVVDKRIREKLLQAINPRADDVMLDVLAYGLSYIVYIWNIKDCVAIKYIIGGDFEIERKEVL